MTLLLDTHIVLWWWGLDARLTPATRDAIALAGTVLVSAASAWEVAIKQALGRLALRDPFTAMMDSSGFTELPVTCRHADAVAGLTPHHRDPFDRLLIAQATLERATLVTHDRHFKPYNLPVLWA